MDELARQHTELLQHLDALWNTFVIIVFLMIGSFAGMIFVAAWSVHSINKRSEQMQGEWKNVLQIFAANAAASRCRMREHEDETRHAGTERI